MVNQTRQVSSRVGAPPDRHLLCVEREVGIQRRRDLPADDHTGEDIDHERRVDSVGECSAIGDVGDPQLVRSVGDEPALDQICRTVRFGLRSGGAWTLAPRSTFQSGFLHQSFHRAPGDRCTLSAHFGIDLQDAVHAVVVVMDGGDLLAQFPITCRTGRFRVGLGGAIGARRDRDVGVFQRIADRLDAVFTRVSVDRFDLHLCGRSNSAAKKAEACLKIVFARRSSLTSRSSSARRDESSLVVPGRRPSSTSARLTHVRSASGWAPSWSATRL